MKHFDEKFGIRDNVRESQIVRIAAAEKKINAIFGELSIIDKDAEQSIKRDSHLTRAYVELIQRFSSEEEKRVAQRLPAHRMRTHLLGALERAKTISGERNNLGASINRTTRYVQHTMFVFHDSIDDILEILEPMVSFIGESITQNIKALKEMKEKIQQYIKEGQYEDFIKLTDDALKLILRTRDLLKLEQR